MLKLNLHEFACLVSRSTPGCIPCKTHAGVTPAAPQVYAKLEGWRTTEMRRLKEPCVEISILLHQYDKDYSLGYIYVTTTTRKLTPRRRSSGLSAWNAPWVLLSLCIYILYHQESIIWSTIFKSEQNVFKLKVFRWLENIFLKFVFVRKVFH